MSYRGKIRNGVVVLEPGVVLPEGSEVAVEPLDTKQTPSNEKASTQRDEDLDPVFRIDELAVNTGIRDLAENIDHYLYGHPRRDDDDA